MGLLFALTSPHKYSWNPNAKGKIDLFEVPGKGRAEEGSRYSWALWKGKVCLPRVDGHPAGLGEGIIFPLPSNWGVWAPATVLGFVG